MKTLKLTKKKEKYPEYKDSGVEWLGDVPKGWGFKRLRFLVLVQKGVVPRDTFSQADIELFGDEVNNYTPYLSMDYLRKRNEYELTKKVFGVNVENNDILILWDGSKAGEFIRAKEGVLGSTMAVIHVYPNNHQQYLFWLLKAFQRKLQDFTVGMGIPHVNPYNLKDAVLFYPDRDTQQKIADYLDQKTETIDKIIEKKKRLVTLLEEKRVSVINHAVTKGLDPNAELVDSGIDWIGKIPKGWEVRKVKHVGKTIIGLTYSPEDIVNEESGTLVLRSSNLQNGTIVFNDNVYVEKKISDKLVVKNGDVLVCARNGSRSLVGKSAYVDSVGKKITFGAFMAIYRGNFSEYISYFLKSNAFYSQLSSTYTSTINQLTSEYFNNIIVTVPQEYEQKKIIEFLKNKNEGFEVTIKKTNQSIKLLQEYRASLISNVVTGKIKI